MQVLPAAAGRTWGWPARHRGQAQRYETSSTRRSEQAVAHGEPPTSYPLSKRIAMSDER